MMGTLKPGGTSKKTAPAEADGDDWNAVYVRARCERTVSIALAEKGHEVFIPFYKKTSVWSDRLKVADAPLSPGYVFCRSKDGSAPSCITTPGVIGFVKSGERVAAISNIEIGSIRRTIESSAHLEPWTYLPEGERVEVIAGPLAEPRGL